MVIAHPEIAGLVDWRPLARGGFSTVWRARQESLHREVAVKIDHRPLSEDKDRRRFLREAGAAGRLSGHPGIVTVHDAGILPDARPFLVMDLSTGGSLTRWLRPEGRQSEQRVRDVGVRIADALAAAHERGVLHRDVKPANILIDGYDHPGLADFGLAALPEADMAASVTLEGMTPAYAAPEVFHLRPPTEYGDVYSLAATLYALLDGKPPRWPDTGAPSLPQLLELQKEPIPRLPTVDPAFMDVLLRAMDPDPGSRPTAAAFRDQLDALTLARPATATALLAASADPAPGRSGATTEGMPGGAPSATADVATAGSTASGAAASGATRLGGAGRRRSFAAIVLASVVVLGVLLFTLFDGSPSTRGAVTPVPVPAPVSATPSPTPTPTPANPSPSPSLPAGFADCSKQLGGESFCLTSPECWGEMNGYADSPNVVVMEDCDKTHVQQTFAAGVLARPANRQSQLEARAEVKALCTFDHLNQVLATRKALKDWTISPVTPQVNIESDNYFRCLFTVPGGSKHALKLKVPAQ